MVYPGAAARRERAARARGVARDRAPDLPGRRLGDPAARLRRVLRGAVRALRDRAPPGARAPARTTRSPRCARAGVATAVVSNFDRRLRGILADLELAPLLDLVVAALGRGRGQARPGDLHERARARSACAAERALVRRQRRSSAISRPRARPACARSTWRRLLLSPICRRCSSASYRRSRTAMTPADRARVLPRPLRSRRHEPRRARSTPRSSGASTTRICSSSTAPRTRSCSKRGSSRAATATSSRASACARRSASARATPTATSSPPRRSSIAARTARAISRRRGRGQPRRAGRAAPAPRDLYPVAQPPTDAAVARKIELRRGRSTAMRARAIRASSR